MANDLNVSIQADISGLGAAMAEAKAAVQSAFSQMADAAIQARSQTAAYSQALKEAATGQIQGAVATEIVTEHLKAQQAAVADLTAAKKKLADAEAYVAELSETEAGAVVELNAALSEGTVVATNFAAAQVEASEGMNLAAAAGGLAGREVGGFLGAQLGRVAAQSAALAPILSAAFPIIAVAAAAQIVYSLAEGFIKVRDQGVQAAENISSSFQKMNDDVRAAGDSLLTQNDRLQAQLDKLEGHPGRNELKITFDEAAESADKLYISIDRDLEKMQQLVAETNQKNQIGFWSSLFTGNAQTGDTQKVVTDAIAGIRKVNDEYQSVLENASASGNKENLAQAQQAELVQLQDAYKNAEGSISASLKTITDKQYVFEHSGIGENQTANINILRGALQQLAEEQRNIGEQYHNEGLQQQITPMKDLAVAARTYKEQQRQILAADKESAALVDRGANKELEAYKKLDELKNKASDSGHSLMPDEEGSKELDTYVEKQSQLWSAQTQLYDIQEQNASAMAEATIRYKETTGAITPLQGAYAQAAEHAQEFTQKLVDLNEQLRVELELGKDVAAAQTRNQIVQVKGQQSAVGLADQSSIQRNLVDPYVQGFNQISQAWMEVQNKLIMGGRGAWMAIREGEAHMVLSVIDGMERLVLKSIETDARQVLSNQLKNAANTTSNATAAAATVTISAATSLKEVMHAAAVAAAKTYGAVAGVPIIGPIIAPIAAAGAYGAVLTLAAFDEGTSYVPRDGVAMIHKGEYIMPPASADILRDALASRSGQSAGQSRGSIGTFNLNYHAGRTAGPEDVSRRLKSTLRNLLPAGSI